MSVSNPLASLSENDIVAQHALHPLDNHYLSEMLRRHMRSSEKLGNAMRFLTVLLLIFTVILVVFEGAMIKRSHESVATGAWVLWGSADTPKYSSGFGVVTAYPTLQQCDTALQDEASRLTREGFTVSSPKDRVIMAFKGTGANIAATRYSCLPDTVDPRGPKGK